MEKKKTSFRPLFIGRPCRFKSKKAYDRAKEKERINNIMRGKE